MSRALTPHQVEALSALRAHGPSTTRELFGRLSATWPYGRLGPVLHALEAKGLAGHVGTPEAKALLWWATTRAVDVEYRDPSAAPSTAEVISAAERAIDESIEVLRAAIVRQEQGLVKQRQNLAALEARQDQRRAARRLDP